MSRGVYRPQSANGDHERQTGPSGSNAILAIRDMLRLKSKASVSKMEHVDWDDLRLLVAIAREGTMRSAAAACDLSAPTLSRRLTELERRLGEPLIDRVPSGCTVTTFGARVLAWAEQMEDLAHRIERAGDVSSRGGPQGTVRINAVEWPSYI